MENQHRAITGYAELSETEIADLNEVKDLGNRFGELIQKLRQRRLPTNQAQTLDGADVKIESYEPRWLSIGATDIQTGCMALVRAIARPNGFA
jgi:hypothetical protein